MTTHGGDRLGQRVVSGDRLVGRRVLSYLGLTEAEHLEWVRARAIVYADQGDHVNCLASLQHDLALHPALRDHPAIVESAELAAAGKLRTRQELRAFVAAL